MKQRGKTIAAFLLSAAFLLIGLVQGQNGQVFRKAVKVCLECIGLG